MLRLSRAVGVRAFSSARALGFRQKGSESEEGGAPTRQRTPKKGQGEHRGFREAAAYSQYNLKAPKVEAVTLDPTDVDAPSPVLRYVDDVKDLSEGEVVTLPGDVIAVQHRLGSFKPNSFREAFRDNTFLVRGQLEALRNSLLEAEANKGKILKVIFEGDAGIGKTSALAQAHAIANMRKWVVLHIPRVQKLIDGTTDFLPNEAAPGTYFQPMAARRFVKQMLRANREILPAATQQTIGEVLKNKSTTDFITPFIEAVKATKLPVLFTADNINILAQSPFSKYRNTEFEPIYSGQLQMVALLRDIISGRMTFESGAVLTATSSAYSCPTTINAAFGREKPLAYTPIEVYDEGLSKDLANLKSVRVEPFTTTDTWAYVRYLQAAGLSRPGAPLTENSDQLHAVTGSGVPRYILEAVTSYTF